MMHNTKELERQYEAAMSRVETARASLRKVQSRLSAARGEDLLAEAAALGVVPGMTLGGESYRVGFVGVTPSSWTVARVHFHFVKIKKDGTFSKVSAWEGGTMRDLLDLIKAGETQ